jgi:hypothetical protein
MAKAKEKWLKKFAEAVKTATALLNEKARLKKKKG